MTDNKPKRRIWPWLPFAFFLLGAILTTIGGYQRVKGYQQIEATVIGVVKPGSKRAELPRELFEMTLPSGRKVQAYGAVVGQSSANGDKKLVYYDPEEQFADVYEEAKSGHPNTGPVYTTLVSVILAPSVLWVMCLVSFFLTRYVVRLKPVHPEHIDGELPENS